MSVCNFLIVSFSIMFICIGFITVYLSKIKSKRRSKFLSSVFDKIGYGILSGIFVSFLVKSSEVVTNSQLFLAHILVAMSSITFILWSIALKANWEL